MRSIRLILLFVALALGASRAVLAETRVALVIGESAYQRVAPLANPARDATAIAELLKSARFSTVRLEIDRGKKELQQALRDFADLAETADVAALYYAGHGVEIGGKNYLVPVDADLRSDLDADDQAVDLDYVLKRMEGARKLKLVMLDACRNNPFKIKARGRSIGRGLAAPSGAESGTLIAFAAQPGETAEDGDGDHSPYAQALLDHLTAPGAELGMALRRVHDAVLRSSGRKRQEPWTNGAIGAEEIYFGPKAGAAAASAGPSADEAAWRFVKSSKDAAQVQEFIDAYPGSRFRAEAEALLARLRAAAAARPAAPAPQQVAAVTPAAPPMASNPCGGATLASLSARTPAPLTPCEERALAAKDVFKECPSCPEMVVVPAGSFTMGSPLTEKDRSGSEDPQHVVTIGKPFAVGRFAVTFDEWDACVADRGCGGYRPKDEGWERKRRPVIKISWNDAKLYLDWLSRKTGKTYRLLSEAEWEYAARVGTTTPFSFGANITPDQVNYDGNYPYAGGAKGLYRGRTVPVGSLPGNAWGLYEMHGNVWQWVEDAWHSSYAGAPGDGSVWDGDKAADRAIRGGSWINDARFARSASRGRAAPDFRIDFLGFRCARVQE